MAKDYSFDVVCRTDMQEVANAVNQASKEIGTSGKSLTASLSREAFL